MVSSDLEFAQTAGHFACNGGRRSRLVLRDDFGPDSDVDVLVEFQTGQTPGLEFFAMEAKLGAKGSAKGSAGSKTRFTLEPVIES